MRCCGGRPRRYLNQEIAQIQDLAPRLDRQGHADNPQEYLCRECGQTWYLAWMPAMHSDIPVVYQEGASPNPFFDEDGRDTRTWASQTPPAGARPGAESAPFVVCLVIGLLTLPAGDSATRRSWLLLWMGAGLLAWFVFPRPGKPKS
jgi:hypothetical protein